MLLTFIGMSQQLQADDTCINCHGDIVEKWSSSHHAKAMLPATDKSVLGDFSGIIVEHNGQSATFINSDGYYVTMRDEGGAAERYRITYTFGITPLQQYLVETDAGKYQVLPFAWDTRNKDAGGQRWFHMYPEEYLPEGDRLHWQQPLQNWNGMCADCHSSGLKRNYDLARDIFKTTYADVNVSCSSCHVDTKDHAAAKANPNLKDNLYIDSLVKTLKGEGSFTLKEGDNTATWSGHSPRQQPELEVCAACHSRRSPLTDGFDPNISFLDQFSPTLLDNNIYFPDGQIQGEDYVWGSFLQSKMYAKGVTCSDCHDSHSLKLKAEGNAVCTTCHSAPVFDTKKHTKHAENTPAAECVSCHMPERTYMVVDPRRDHSFKVPRPDLSTRTDAPNACVSCHSDKTNTWAKDTLNSWFPDSKHRDSDALTIARARKGHPSARVKLLLIIKDSRNSAIKRASALSLVPRIADAALLTAAEEALSDPSPLVRIGALRALAALPAEQRYNASQSALSDPVKAVRVEAARQLIDVPTARLHKTAFTEMMEANEQAAWRGEGRLNIGTYYEFNGETSAAEQQYRQAIKQDPSFAPALINLSELLRRTNRVEESHEILKGAIDSGGNIDPTLYHAYGLSLIRNGDAGNAVIYLEKAMKADRNNPRFAYVYLVAINTPQNADSVYTSLKSLVRRHRYDPAILEFALSLALQRNDLKFSNTALRNLLELTPNNQQLLDLKARLSATR